MENADITVNESSLIENIKEIIITSRKNIVRSVNTEMLSAYWNIGRLIVEDEQKNQERAKYGEQILKTLSKRLTAELGSGFSMTNLSFMRRFYLTYQKFQTVSEKLSWSHYCELLTISDENKRSFYEKECIASKWSVRELKGQLDSSLYERLLLSRGKENKENTAAKLENRIYKEIEAEYFSSASQMVSFASNWRDYSQYDSFLAVDGLYLEAVYEQLESGSLVNEATGVPLELEALRAIEDLPSWAQDPGCSLSKDQTVRLIRLANESGTYVKVLLPQLRRSAQAHGLLLRDDLTTPLMNIKAAYIEEKFRQMGLME